MSTNYSNCDYWDNRYAKEEDNPYDWLFSYSDVKEVIEHLLPEKNAKVLLIGCGNAPFSPDMHANGGYNRLVNIDLSSVVIQQQAAKYPEQIWKVMNALNMDFPDNSFPVIVDKSLIDTLLCGAGSKEKTECLIHECFRVLEPGGRFITFSLHDVHEVEAAYRDAGVNWKVSFFRIKSDRWNPTNGRKRSRAHTMIVCDKACADGSHRHAHPLDIPTGTLSDKDYWRLKEEAEQVNLRCALRTAPMDFLRCALYDALAGESTLRNLRCRYLEELCTRVGTNGDDLENLSTTPVLDDTTLLQEADFDVSLAGRVPEVRAELRQALRDVRKLGSLVPGGSGLPAPTNADSQ